MKARTTAQKRKAVPPFEDDTRATAKAIIVLARTHDTAEESVIQLLRAYASRVRASSNSPQRAQKTGTLHSSRQKRNALEAKRSTAHHVCDKCRHKYDETTMHHVGLHDGEYTMWSSDRATHFRSHRWKYPTLVWLCASCYSAAQQAQEIEWRTGDPAPASQPTARPPWHKNGRK